LAEQCLEFAFYGLDLVCTHGCSSESG
jgi:hypothetical protein